MIGFPRHLSQHVGGFVLTERPLTRPCRSAMRAMADRTVIEWDKDDIDDARHPEGRRARARHADLHPQGVRADRAASWRTLGAGDHPARGSEVYEMLCRADSIGVFQVESRAQMNMLPRLRPREFYDLVIEVAIVRPGPIQGDMVHPYLKRRAGKEQVTFPARAQRGPAGRARADSRPDDGRADLPGAGDEDRDRRGQIHAREADQLRKAMATFRSQRQHRRARRKMVAGMIDARL